MPSDGDSKQMSRLFNPTSADNEQIMNHVRVHVESNEKSKIPVPLPTSNREKRQLAAINEPTSYYGRPIPMIQPPYSRYIEPEHEYKPQIHVNIETERKRNEIEDRPKRSLATEQHITVPNGAENILGVVNQKRVEEEVEQTSGKRNKILKLVKRQMYEQPQQFWEPRATIRGNRVMKNPILQLLRSAAGQKTQRILGLNSKAFDIFPGPLPEERNIALNNNLGRVSNEAPTNRYPGVDQQILRSFRKPSSTFGRQQLQQQQYIRNKSPSSMYRQQIQQQRQQRQQEQEEFAALQQRTFAPRQQHSGYIPRMRQQARQQQMESMEDYSQGIASTRGFSNFVPFTPTPQQQQPQQSYQESAGLKEMYSRGGEEVMMANQQQRQQMFMRPSPYSSSYNSMMMYHPERIQQERAQMRDIPQRPYQETPAQRREMPTPYQEEIPQYQEANYQQEAPMPMGSAFPQESAAAAQYRRRPQYPLFEQPDYEQGFQRTIQRKQSKVATSQSPFPDMKFNEQIGKLLEATSSNIDPALTSSSSQAAVAPSLQEALPVEESRQMIEGGGDVGLPHYSPSSMYGGESSHYNGGESSHRMMMAQEEQPIEQRMIRPMFSHFSTLPPFPYYRRPTHQISSHIPTMPQHHREDEDDFGDEKPEVHVHIQTEKSHISKPYETAKDNSVSMKAKKS